MTCNILEEPSFSFRNSFQLKNVLRSKKKNKKNNDNNKQVSSISTESTDFSTSTSTSSTGTTRSVRFATQDMKFEVESVRYEKHLWFTEDELNVSRLQALHEIDQWRAKGYEFLVDESFENPENPNVEDKIIAFTSQDGKENKRGLEQYCSPRHRDGRYSNKKRAMQTLLAQQRVLRGKNNNNNQNNGNNEVDEISEKLRSTSRIFSRKSELYALSMGKADEVAIGSVPKLTGMFT